jgi:hypothetical protein
MSLPPKILSILGKRLRRQTSKTKIKKSRMWVVSKFYSHSTKFDGKPLFPKSIGKVSNPEKQIGIRKSNERFNF